MGTRATATKQQQVGYDVVAGNGLAEKATAEVSNSGHVKWRTENPFVSPPPS